jgi:ABC-2 type transport system ATP-binding protein
MKAETAAALLHRPQVLFLDEPTIGLDVTAQKRIRAFLAEYNRRTGASILMTSHYMADVQALCSRVVVIDAGQVLYDGGLRALTTRFAAHQTITVGLPEGAVDLSGYGEVVESTPDGRTSLRVPKAQASAVAARLLAAHRVSDLTIEDPPIEDVIEQVFASRPAPTAPVTR